MGGQRIDGPTRDAIARMWEAGWTQGQLAVRFKVTQQAVGGVLRRIHGARYDEARLVHEANRDGIGTDAARMPAESLERVVWDMFKQGWACSDIDSTLKLSRGRAHAIVLGRWADDKERADRARVRILEAGSEG